MEYMREHLAEPLDLRSCARAAGYSVAQYSARFREQCGTPPMHYLRELRIQTASRQLDHTPRPIETIAAAVGYPDPLHFSSVFHAVTELNPSQYRHRVNG